VFSSFDFGSHPRRDCCALRAFQGKNRAAGTKLAVNFFPMEAIAAETNPSVQTIVARSRTAQVGWALLSFRQRATLLRRLAARLRSDEELVRLISAETGKPRFEAFGFEVGYVSELVRFFTGRQGRRSLAADTRSSLIFPHKRAQVAWRPRGVVAVIGPWNFPLLNNFGDAVAPLLAGNSVVLKPSPHTPRTSRRVQELWRELELPTDVFQVVPGGAEVAGELVDACDMVFFTGSVAAGRQIAARAGERLIPCVAELGGKSAMIVLADADLPAAARAATWGAFAGAGQICVRVERALVEEKVADEFARLVVAQAQALRLGPEGDFDVGPVLLPAQLGRYQSQIDDAVQRGARVLIGGAVRGAPSERLFAPTVIDHVPPEATVAREETFGPVLPILRVADAEQAVKLCNASNLGLSASVWSRDASAARALASRLVTGSVCINDVLVNYFFVAAPLGAAKAAGLGFRHGPEALQQFCYPQSIVDDRPSMGWLAGWVRRQLGFPYRQRVLDVLRWLMKAIYR
jgi:succinate-semialdehyde dehydrogenase / glutarate-semialdehyde dehydrogenase